MTLRRLYNDSINGSTNSPTNNSINGSTIAYINGFMNGSIIAYVIAHTIVRANGSLTAYGELCIELYKSFI